MARGRSDFPVCSYPEKDCRGLDDWGHCCVLYDTDFRERACPFYKRQPYGKEKQHDQQRH